MSTSVEGPREVDRGSEVDGSPAARSARPEDDGLAEESVAVDLRAVRRRDRREPPRSSGQDGRAVSHSRRPPRGCRRGRAADAPDVLLVLEDDAQRLVDEGRLELPRPEGEEGGRPVERLGDAGDLGQVGLAEPMDEADDLAGQTVRGAGTRARTMATSLSRLG